jgi:glycosyltransferase involved in cell wall biosynthesis
MKILIYSLFLPILKDGASASGRGLVKYLRHREPDVTVCTTNSGWTKEQIIVRGEEDEHLNIFCAWPAFALEFSPALIYFFYRKLKSFDVVHFRGLFSLCTICGAYMAGLLGVPYVVSPVGDRVPLWSERKEIRRGTIKHLYYRLLISKVLKRASRIVCTSEMEAGLIRQLEGAEEINNNIVSIPDGIDIGAYSIPVSRNIVQERIDKNYFLFIGRLSKEKGLEFLIKVWGAVTAIKNDLYLVVAGDDDLNPGYTDFLKKMILSIGSPETVILPGAVIGDLKLALLQNASCLVFPSYYESFGIVVLEALASGTPVVASMGTPWQSLETNDFGYWLPLDKDLWAKTLIEMSEGGMKKRNGFASRSKQWVVEHFKWDHIADRYLDVYKRAIEERHIMTDL